MSAAHRGRRGSSRLLGALLLGALALAALLAPAAGARAARRDGGLEALLQVLEADVAATTRRAARREPDGPRAAPADSELGVAPLHRLLRSEVEAARAAASSKQLQREEPPPRDGRQLAQVTVNYQMGRCATSAPPLRGPIGCWVEEYLGTSLLGSFGL